MGNEWERVLPQLRFSFGRPVGPDTPGRASGLGLNPSEQRAGATQGLAPTNLMESGQSFPPPETAARLPRSAASNVARPSSDVCFWEQSGR